MSSKKRAQSMLGMVPNMADGSGFYCYLGISWGVPSTHMSRPHVPLQSDTDQ